MQNVKNRQIEVKVQKEEIEFESIHDNESSHTPNNNLNELIEETKEENKNSNEKD